MTEPQTITDYEDWTILPDSVIHYGYRNIRATEKVGNWLYVQAANAHYILDSNLQLDEGNYNILQRNVTKYPLSENVKHNDEYIIYPESEEMLVVKDAKQINLEQINGYIHLPTLVDDYGNSHGQFYNWSEITEDNHFDVVLLAYKGDTALYTLIEFKIEHTSGSFQKIQVTELNRLVIAKNLDDRTVSRDRRIKVWRLNDQRFVSIFETGKLYRYQGNTLMDVNQYNITNIFEHNAQLYAGSAFINYFTDSLTRNPGLISTANNGATWTYVGHGDDFVTSNIKSMDDYLVLYRGSVIGIIDLESGNIKRADLTGLDAQINSIEKIGDKVVVGTDAGVYYKTWRSFLNKKS